MRWLLVGRCSPAPPWRTSSTSSSGYWVSDFFQAGSPNVPKNVTIHVNASIHQWEYVLYLRVCDSVTTGTPTEENWPGISSVEEFKSYNFPKYKPQPLINHAPRYCCPFVCAGLHTPVHWLCIPTDLFFFFFSYIYTPMVRACLHACSRVFVTCRKSCRTFHRQPTTSFLSWASTLPSPLATGRQ